MNRNVLTFVYPFFCIFGSPAPKLLKLLVHLIFHQLNNWAMNMLFSPILILKDLFLGKGGGSWDTPQAVHRFRPQAFIGLNGFIVNQVFHSMLMKGNLKLCLQCL